MKKTIFTITVLIISLMAFGQEPEITFRFSNPTLVSGINDSLQFDIEAKCDLAGIYHRDLQIYFNYNSVGFGENIVGNEKIRVQRLELLTEQFSGADKYEIVGMADNSNSRFVIGTQSLFPGFDPQSFPMFFTLITTDFQGLFRITIEISDMEELAGISFYEQEMNAGQYYQGAGEALSFSIPSLYANNLETQPLWEPAITSTWVGTNGTAWFDGGNWSDNIPWESTDVTIPDVSQASGNFPSVSENIHVSKLTIQPGGQLTISDSKGTFTVNGDLLLQSDENSTASLIETGNLSISGSTTIQQWVSEDEWNYISSPVQNGTAAVFQGMWLKYFNEPTNEWTYIDDLGQDLEFGKGYATWTTTSENIEFNGQLNNAEQSLDLSFTDDDPHGFNLVGNPFPSAINWDNIPSENKTNLDGTIYVWNGTNYLYWNGSLGNLGDGIIPPMQSFFVHANATSPSLLIDNASRVHSQKPFYKSMQEKDELENYLAFTIQGSGFEDMTYIHFNPVSTIEFDPDFDAHKLYGIEESVNMYTSFDGIDYAINVLPETNSSLIIPVNIKVGTGGTYQFSVDGIDSFEYPLPVMLEDLKTGMIHDLFTSNAFSVELSPDDDHHRFNLYFTNIQSVNSHVDEIGIEVYGNNGNVYIRHLTQNNSKIHCEVYSIHGNKILQKTFTGEAIIPIDSRYPFVIVKLTNETVTIQKKINIR